MTDTPETDLLARLDEAGGHSPGPWWVAGKATIRSGKDSWVASANWERQQANARLIALAPELADAYRALRAQLAQARADLARLTDDVAFAEEKAAGFGDLEQDRDEWRNIAGSYRADLAAAQERIAALVAAMVVASDALHRADRTGDPIDLLAYALGLDAAINPPPPLTAALTAGARKDG